MTYFRIRDQTKIGTRKYYYQNWINVSQVYLGQFYLGQVYFGHVYLGRSHNDRE